MPSAIIAICKASVPELTVTQCAAPQKAASFCSSSVTSGPSTNWQCFSTVSSRRRSSAWIRACCAFRSRNGRDRAGAVTGDSLIVLPSGAGAASAVRVVLEFRDHAAQHAQRQTGLATSTGGGQLLDRAADDGRVGGAWGRHQQAGIPGRQRRLPAVEQFLVQL